MELELQDLAVTHESYHFKNVYTNTILNNTGHKQLVKMLIGECFQNIEDF